MLAQLRGSTTVGLHVPGVSTVGLESHTAYAAFFRESEALGFDALWVEDRILHPAPLADPIVLLTWAAAHTERMLLGTAVLVLNLRRAPVAARQIATLNHLSAGRLVLGVSLGGRPDEYEALGIDPGHRAALFEEGVATLRALLAGEPVDRPGRWFPLAGATVRPPAPVPILMGGIADPALRRAGRLADGWIMAPFGSLDDFRRGWSLVRAGAEQAGRDPDALVAGRLLYVAVDDDPARGRAALQAFLHGYYGERFDVDRHAIFGPPAEVRARLREQIEAGISHLMLGVPTLDLEHLRRLAGEVLPALRG